MLDADAIREIVNLGDASSCIEEHGGHFYHVNRERAELLKIPPVELTSCFSLTQLVNFLKAFDFKIQNDDGEPVSFGKRLLINVLDFNKVQVMDDERDLGGKLVVYAEADFAGVYPPFPMDKRLSQEEFVINVMTKFERDASATELLKLVSQVKAEKVKTSDDDGFSQVASTKSGVMLSVEKAVKNIWDLKPFKTFPEVEQPTVPYVLRLHQMGDSMPQFALYDCDGGAWKVKLTASIRQWLELKLKEADLADKVMVL